MPTEILSHIFAFTLPPHQQDAESAPWTISAVCARWRSIVLSQPNLWTFIRYHDQDTHIPSGADVLKLETQLLRSGQAPLHIDFLVQEHSDDEEIVQMMYAHTERWETASFTGPEELCEHLRSYIQGPFPQLREVTIEIDKAYPSDDDNIVLDMFHDAPLLQAAFVNRESWATPVTMALPWSQLLRFGGRNTWEGHLAVLGSASNLVDCSLEIPGSDRITQTLLRPIVLPRLLRLSPVRSPIFGMS
ncbi:hypothetical protein MSAN_00658200 [Mycena sanguinolenta]|uniref:F-box domain-containing protein n=1 Tax=Mycena sanguinolenta TaxID=230812 RepID=A0A8H7DDD3_9AGAR|nr:hypothetical protein MSAN_00658200 [Mycena sanguinolenta]